MSGSGDMSALLEALKRKEGASATGATSDGPSMSDADPSLPGDDPSPQPDGEDASATNAKIVDMLQSQYPKIFAKISQMVEDDPDSGSDTDLGAVSPDPMGS